MYKLSLCTNIKLTTELLLVHADLGAPTGFVDPTMYVLSRIAVSGPCMWILLLLRIFVSFFWQVCG